MSARQEWRAAWRLIRGNKGMILCSERWITRSVMESKAAYLMIKRELGELLPKPRPMTF